MPKSHLVTPVMFPFPDGQEIPIFGFHGEPFPALIRNAFALVGEMKENNSIDAAALLTKVMGGMSSDNAVVVYRTARATELNGSSLWILGELSERLLILGYMFTTAQYDDRGRLVGIIHRGNERITYVHNPGRDWIPPGTRVLVPSRPAGEHLAGSRKQGWSVWRLRLQPDAPLLRFS